MRLLIYGINYAPEPIGVGKYTGEFAAWLAARGHEVRVVTAPPYYPDWSVAPGFSGRCYRVERSSAIRVYRCPLSVPAEPGGLRGLLHLASFALSSLPVALWQATWRPDVVWVVEPSLFCAPTALLVARMCGARAWLHVQDYEADVAFDFGLIRSETLRRVVAAGERGLMRRFDRVSTISARMLERAREKGVPAEKLASFPNWVDVDSVTPPEGTNPYRGMLGIGPNDVVVLYSGAMGPKQDLEILARAASRASGQAGLVFVFCGSGPGRADLEARCGGLPNARFLEVQPVERVGALLGMADIHVLPQRAAAADLVMPSKLTGMLASGRPVVATCDQDTQLADVVGSCGVVVPPGDVDSFLKAIRDLAADEAKRARFGKVAREYAEEHLAHRQVLSRFEAALEEACIQ